MGEVMTTTDYLAAAELRGLVFSVNGTRLLVSPRELVSDDDRVYIAANKSAIMELLASQPPCCCDICPGPENTLCAGCSSILEYLMPDGLIVDNWCAKVETVRGATHVRNRWDRGEWTPIAKKVQP